MSLTILSMNPSEESPSSFDVSKTAILKLRSGLDRKNSSNESRKAAIDPFMSAVPLPYIRSPSM